MISFHFQTQKFLLQFLKLKMNYLIYALKKQRDKHLNLMKSRIAKRHLAQLKTLLVLQITLKTKI